MTEVEIFMAALDLPDASVRTNFLNEACGENVKLREHLEALLANHFRCGEFLDVPAVEQMQTQLGDEDTVAWGDAQTIMGQADNDENRDLSFLAPPSEPDSLGRLDHYEILEVVGSGGMGIVLRARDTKLMRIVAVKVLAPPLATSGSARKRFVREARAAAAVRDEHVVAIHAVCDDGPMPYLVMEFIDGTNLEMLLRRGGPLEVKEILRIGMQIANGLAAAHKQGLIHRDVKPANILLENGVQRVKLTDFGLARAADDASLTRSGLIAGSPLYMSPEQAAGEPIDTRTDLFSLGSVIYEMCTGRPAFRASSTVAVIKRVCADTPRPIREVNCELPQTLCELVDRLHAKKPADRPASAKEVAGQLAEMLAEVQGQSAAPLVERRTAARSRPSGARAPWLWAAAALVLLCVALGLGEATGVTNLQGTVLRLLSSDGVLVVELDDPAVSVSVDGEELVITGAGPKEIRLKPGQYKVQASKDGKVVLQELVTVTQNGRKIVRISKEGAAPETTDAQPWEDSIAQLAADNQVAAVAQRLKELNPGFDGKVDPAIEEGVVKGLSFSTASVADISPLRALRRLQSLNVSGDWPQEGKLSDLGPLRGLPLTSLICGGNPIADLSPLRGMPLKHLACGATHVSDLTPLQGMPLERLELTGTQVADLAPLDGMPLTWLRLDGLNKVSNLSPLKGMPLEFLSLRQVPASNLSPLAECTSLRELIFPTTHVSDLSPLRGLRRLESLDCSGQWPNDGKLSDLAPLRGLPLTKLVCGSNPIADLTPLQGMPLKMLGCGASRVSDLSPLKGMPLEALHLISTPAADLSPLAEIRSLRELLLDHTQVSDLTPIAGLPLHTLSLTAAPVSDLTPIKSMRLKRLCVDNHADQQELLRSLAGLEFINDKPVAEFWKNIGDQ